MTESASYEQKADLPHVLIVDDDERIRALVSRFLAERGFLASTAASAAQASDILKSFSYDALVLDIMMPGETGLAFTSRLRREGCDLPVLLLTALGETEDRIAGFETGADDYLPKPFEPRELVLRLQSLLKRKPKKMESRSFRIGAWVYDPDHCLLTSDMETVRLTSVEDRLLRALAGNQGEAVSREDLAALCEVDAGERTIDVQVTRLRRKLEQDTKNPLYLQTVRGKGYLLRVEYL